jgi:ribosomal protein S14
LIIFDIFYGLCGWLVGIAINYAADLLPNHETVRQRPHCLNCGTPRPPAAWSGLLAVLSGQRHCIQCGRPTSRCFVHYSRLATLVFFIFLGRTYGFRGT